MDPQTIPNLEECSFELLKAARLASTELERITGDIGFEPERFRERMRALWALSRAMETVEKAIQAHVEQRR